MKGLPVLIILLALASLTVIHVRDNPVFWKRLTASPSREMPPGVPVDTQESTVDDRNAEDLSEKEEEPLYKDTLDEADQWIGKAAVEYWRCAAQEKNRDEHARRLLEYTDEALNVLDWLDTVYPDRRDIQERMEETYKMRQAALRLGAGD